MLQEGLGTLQGHEVAIVVDPQAAPCFSKARPVAYAVRPKVEAELERLVEEGTLETVQFSEWASPIVAVIKRDKTSVRICGDFKQSTQLPDWIATPPSGWMTCLLHWPMGKSFPRST